MCHVLEMEGRYNEGSTFLESTEANWKVSRMIELSYIIYSFTTSRGRIISSVRLNGMRRPKFTPSCLINVLYVYSPFQIYLKML